MDENGIIAFSLPGDQYHFSFTKEGYDTLFSTIDLSKDTTIALYLNRESYRLTFEVHDSLTRESIQGASLAVEDSVYETNAQGQCTLILEYGTHGYTLTKDGYDQYAGSLSVSADTTIKILLCTSINNAERLVSNKIQMYPNPVARFLTIETSDKSEFIYEIYDVTGELNLTGRVNTNKYNLNASSLLPGMYLIKVSDREGFAMHKFVKY
jgi:hypothetical protein